MPSPADARQSKGHLVGGPALSPFSKPVYFLAPAFLAGAFALRGASSAACAAARRAIGTRNGEQLT